MPFAIRRDADPRVLKSQLDVIAAIDRSSWVVTPVWALILALLASNAAFLSLGDLPLGRALFFPALVIAASYIAYGLYAGYLREASQTPARLAIWSRRFLAAQIGVSTAWGLLPWLLWEPGNIANHLFLLVAVATTMASLLVSRLGSMTMLVGGMVPIVALTSARFLAAGGALDAIFATLTPVYGFHLYIDGKRFIRALQDDVRLRLKVEDMAIALTRTNAGLFSGPPLVLVGWGSALGALLGGMVGTSANAGQVDRTFRYAIAHGDVVLLAETLSERETLLARDIIEASLGVGTHMDISLV